MRNASTPGPDQSEVMADTADSPEVPTDKPHETSDVTSAVRPGSCVEGNPNRNNTDSSAPQVAPPEVPVRSPEVAAGGGVVDGDHSQEGVRLLERASTLILTRTPSLSRGRSLLIKEEVEVLARVQVPENPDPLEAPGVGDSGSSDCDYDTDLEETLIPITRQLRTKTSRRRDFGRETYRKSCHKLSVLPVAAVLRQLPLQEMTLSYMSLLSRETLALCNALLDNRTIVELNLDGNDLGTKGADYIALLLSDSPRLRICSLADNALGRVGGEAVCEALVTNTSLTAIGLSGNGFTDADGGYFARVFKENKNLHDVDLSHNSFGDYAAESLGPAIGANGYVRTLDLSWNCFRSQGAIFLSRGLEKNSCLRSLNLAMNGFSTRGAISIGQALSKNRALNDLDLTFNRIYDDATISLAKGLLANPSLKYLYLANNPLTTNAALGLLTAIQENDTSAMRVLDMMLAVNGRTFGELRCLQLPTLHENIYLSREIVNCLGNLHNYRPLFRFQFAGTVGSSTNYGNAYTNSGIHDCDPVIILMQFASKNGLRVLEMFKQFDRDGSGSISRAEFVKGIKMFNIPMTESQLDDLIQQLDKDGDGEIDYGELLMGEKNCRRKLYKLKQRLEAKKW